MMPNRDRKRHFTATTLVVHNNKVLLQLHKKLGIWLPPGGHIDHDELPEEAAIREVKEETGLNVRLYNPDIPLAVSDVAQACRPVYILLEKVTQLRQDIDYIYYATATTAMLKPKKGETDELRWFSAKEIQGLSGIPENVAALSLEAITSLSTKADKQ